MKMINRILLSLLISISLTVQFSNAQCVIDSTQTQPGISPDSLVDATVNQFYAEDITFVLITDTLGLNISNFLISSINGLPLGMNWVCDHSANGCNYNPNINLYGCVQIYGTPVLAGTYALSITVVATVAFIGNQTFNFNSQLIVNPASVTNTGFAMTNSLGCSPLTVSFNNNLPGLPYYHWDFGNGDTSNLENPSSITYQNPGDYAVTQISIADTVPNYYLSTIQVDSIPDNAGFLDTPDMFIIIKNQSGQAVYDSHPVLSNTNPPVTFTIQGLQLNNENYTVYLWDEDTGISAPDDNLGNVTFAGHGNSGTAYATVSGASGKLKLIYTIQKIQPAQTIAVDTVHVYPGMVPPSITASGSLTFCVGDTVLLNSNYSGLNQWYRNGNLLVGETNPLLIATNGGSYFNIETNNFGCSDTSSMVNITLNFLPPYPNFTVSGNILSSTAVGTFSYQWFLNDTLLAGANASTYTALVSGNYRLQLVDSNGCTRKSFPISVLITGIRKNINESQLLIYPNPAKEEVEITFTNSAAELVDIKIRDMVGKLVFTESTAFPSSNFNQKINLRDWNKGIYFIELKTNATKIARKLVVH